MKKIIYFVASTLSLVFVACNSEPNSLGDKPQGIVDAGVVDSSDASTTDSSNIAGFKLTKKNILGQYLFKLQTEDSCVGTGRSFLYGSFFEKENKLKLQFQDMEKECEVKIEEGNFATIKDCVLDLSYNFNKFSAEWKFENDRFFTGTTYVADEKPTCVIVFETSGVKAD